MGTLSTKVTIPAGRQSYFEPCERGSRFTHFPFKRRHAIWSFSPVQLEVHPVETWPSLKSQVGFAFASPPFPEPGPSPDVRGYTGWRTSGPALVGVRPRSRVSSAPGPLKRPCQCCFGSRACERLEG